MQVPKEIQDFISNEITGSIRELVGAINRVVSFSRIYNKIPNISETKVILKDLLNLSENKVSTIPMLGKIAAGTPIEAIQHNDDMIDVPRELMSVGESYALKVEGDSMINEGIHEGDTVLIKKTNLAENGDIIVALIDDHEATLKRLRKKGQ